jgi:hypothetical protein
VTGRDAQPPILRTLLRAHHVFRRSGCVAKRRGVLRLCRPCAGRVGAQGVLSQTDGARFWTSALPLLKHERTIS